MTLLPDRPAPVGRPAALSEPVDAVHPRWVLRVTLAGLGLWAGFFGPSRCCSRSRPRSSPRTTRVLAGALAGALALLVLSRADSVWLMALG
jgi:hypothetical protein